VTVTLIAALFLQVVGITLVRGRLGYAWLNHPVPLLYLASVVYQGISAVLLSFPSIAAQDPGLSGIAPGFIADAALLNSAAMLALLLAYLMTQPQRAMPTAIPRAHDLVKTLDWRLAAAACLPLALLTYEGRGYNAAIDTGAPVPLGTDLAVTFFVLLVPVTSCGLVLRYGQKWFLPALLTQSLLLAAAGERTPVLAGAAALVLMLGFAGMRPGRRHLHAAAALAIVAILAITGVRAHEGRSLFTSDTGLGARTVALIGGVTASSPSAQQSAPGLLAQATVRFDANSFAAGILQAKHMGYPLISPAAIPQSLLIVVPSALWPSKLSHGNALDPFQAEITSYGLRDINFLPGLPSLYAGFVSPPWLILFMAVLGAIFGWCERRLLQDVTPARLILLAGAAMAAFRYEAGLPAMLVEIRAALFIALAIKAVDALRARSRARQPSSLP
jgi:hypothetical protein